MIEVWAKILLLLPTARLTLKHRGWGSGDVSQRYAGLFADHVHLLVGLRATHCLADVLHELKKESFIWVHDEIGVPGFAWQEGYAAFTVSPSARSDVKLYIAHQEEHHRVVTFQEEFRRICKKYGVEIDERYAWD